MKIGEHVAAAETAAETVDAYAVVDPGASAMSGVLHALIAIARIQRLRLRREHPTFGPANPCGNAVCGHCYPPGAPARD